MLLALVGAAAGCSAAALDADLPDILPAVDGGSVPAPSPDGGGVRRDASAPSPDATTVPPRPRLCAVSDASVCEDWDGPDGSTWLAPAAQNAAVAVDDAGAATAPASLLATSPAFDGGVRTASAFRELRTTGRGTRFVEDLDIRVEQRGTGTHAQAVNLVFVEGAQEYSVSLLLGETTDMVDESGPGGYAAVNLAQRIVLDKWVHVRLEVIAGGPSSVIARVELDGVKVAERALTTWQGFASGIPVLRNGLVYQSRPGAPWRFRIDSIELRRQ